MAACNALRSFAGRISTVPLDLRHYAARLLPALRLIAEARMETPHVVGGRPTGRVNRWLLLSCKTRLSSGQFRLCSGDREKEATRHGRGHHSLSIDPVDFAPKRE
jgi:hypothetical protein